MLKAHRNPESHWHGFTRTTPEDKTRRVRQVFDSVASRYDLMNDVMSGGLHRLWKNRLVSMMRPKAGQKILDVAGGTGDIALRCAERSNGEAEIIVADINPEMLKIGRAKAIDNGWLNEINWIKADAESLPFPSRSFDTLSIAFGLRNVTRIDTALAEFARVLKPGGRFFCLEFTSGTALWLKDIFNLYALNVIPWLGEHIAKDRASYRYLAESIVKFPDQKTLSKRMKKAGFDGIKWSNLTGGIAVIHSGWRN